MKRNFTRSLFSLVLISTTLFVNAQTWVVYDGVKALTDGTNSAGSAWSEGDKAGTNTAVTLNTDGNGNGSIAFVADGTNRSSFKSTPALTDATFLPANGTYMFRAKSNNVGTTATDFGFMLEVYSKGAVGASQRFDIRLLGDDSIRLNNATVKKYSKVGLNLREYHTYRITVETGGIYKVYLDENATPICEGVSTNSTSSNKMVFRTGNYQGSGTFSTSGELDWLAWDTTAVYKPGEGTLPIGVITRASTARNKELSVYPNPVSNLINIDNATGVSKYEVIGVNGSIVAQGINTGARLSVPISNLKSGIYFIKLYSGTQTEKIRFVKQ